MNKKIIPYIILPVLGLAILGAGTTFAASNSQGEKPMTALVSAIATKFNLNATEVQTVVDQVITEQRAAREAEHDQLFADRLTQAVTDKKLTQDQADKITAKHKEIQSNMANFSEMTGAERQAAQKDQFDSLKKWASDNNIPAQYLMPGIGKKGFGQRGHSGAQSPEGFGPRMHGSIIK